MDELNWKILHCLQVNARESFSNIGRQVGLTPPSVAERVKKMEDLGIIQGYRTDISHTLTGFQLKGIIMLRAFVGKLKPFLDKVDSFDEVINCYRITGNENIVMQVVLKDQFHLEKFIDRLIVYGECRTHIILSTVVGNGHLKKIE
ncbi:Lrp/AsnC family transcriptional regulator [Allomuricauda sp. d1]|uniref:Lrp/AsnC family transcriptional regulator n=1 Tax=Allomuricauda sp. d1 TaxID=3136725 RepID=UPI0031D19171